MDKKFNKQILKNLKKIKIGIPTNWRKITSISIGGFIGIRFSKEKEHLLLVVSHQGRGVINCNTGDKIAREIILYKIPQQRTE